MKKAIDNITRGKAIGFLVWFRNQYKIFTADTYTQIAEKYGQCNYGTCRNMIIELIKAGYLYMWDDGVHKRRIYIKSHPYNELVSPFILNSNALNTENSKD